jgi:hypothetical protein
MMDEVPTVTTTQDKWKEQYERQEALFAEDQERFRTATRRYLAAILRRRLYEHSRNDREEMMTCVALLHHELIGWCEDPVA